MPVLIFQIFFISFSLNLLWEVLHSQLYNTCLKSSLKRYVRLIIGASLKDAFWISLFYLVSVVLFSNTDILANKLQILFFIVIALLFSFVDEKVSVKKGRWQYSGQMPTVLGIGITPLLELAVTGTLAFTYVFLIS